MPLACEVVSVHILATDIVLAHANVAAALVAASALELIAVVVLALHRLLSALGPLADGVPSTLRTLRLAALAARRSACVAAALPTLPLAWEAVPVHIVAADVTLAHTCAATALVPTGAIELGSAMVAMHGRKATPRGFIGGCVVCAAIFDAAQRQERDLLTATLSCIRAVGLASCDRHNAHEKSKRHTRFQGHCE